ncbi:hypothetical protein Tco_0996443 [Tanacetum coccineum]
MAPLPAADQRHPWLRYQVEGYTEGIIHRFGSEVEDGVYWRGTAGVRESRLEETIWDPSTFVRRHAKGRKSGAKLSRGHFIGRLAMHFGLVSDEGLRGLKVATAGAHEVVEAGPTADEGAQEILAPAQAPPPPPPAPQPQTMSQRTKRIEEEMRDLRHDVVGLRGVFESFTTEQSRVSTWLISCMTQLMDASGYPY